MMRLLTGCLLAALGLQPSAPTDVPFRAVEVQRDWGVVYAVRVADVNADRRPDIVTFVAFSEARHTKLWNYDPDRWNGEIAAWLAALPTGSPKR